MRNIVKNIIFAVALAFVVVVNVGKVCGQTTVTIPSSQSDSNTSDLPFAYGSPYSFTEQIYLASEIGVAGTITSMSVKIHSKWSRTGNITVYLGHTDKSVFTGTSSSEWITTGLQQVYKGSLFTSSTGWNEIVFSSPFTYDGSRNLVVVFQDNEINYIDYISHNNFDKHIFYLLMNLKYHN